MRWMVVFALACRDDDVDSRTGPVDSEPDGESPPDTEPPIDTDGVDTDSDTDSTDTDLPPDTDEPPEPVFGRYSGTLSVEDEAWAILRGTYGGERVGASIAPVGDTNGDGFDDFVVAAECDRTVTYQSGEVRCWKVLHTVLGPPPWGRRALANSTAATFDYRLSGERLFGADRLEPAPDVTGDGFADLTIDSTLLVGPFDGPWQSIELAAGQTVFGTPDLTGDGRNDLLAAEGDVVRVYAGPLTAVPGEAAAIIRGSGGFGSEVTYGNLIQPNDPAVAIAAPYDARGGPWAGAVYVFRPGLSGEIDATAADVVLVGTFNDRAGYTLDAGDIKRNGIDELVIGGTFHTIPSGGEEIRDEVALDTIHRRIWTEDCGILQPARMIGDIDGDGHQELLLQNANHDAIELYYGPANDYGDPDAVFVLPGAAGPLCTMQIELAALGDVDGDELADFAIGDPRGPGAVYVLLGRAPHP